MTDTRAIATSRNGTDSTTSMSRASTVSTIAAEEPGRQPDARRRSITVMSGRDDPDEQRDASAVRDPHEDVPAEVVGAQPERAVRGPRAGRPAVSPISRYCSFGGCPVIAGEHRREDRHQDDQHDDDERDHRHLVPAQSLPRQHPWTSPLDASGLAGIHPSARFAAVRGPPLRTPSVGSAGRRPSGPWRSCGGTSAHRELSLRTRARRRRRATRWRQRPSPRRRCRGGPVDRSSPSVSG